MITSRIVKKNNLYGIINNHGFLICDYKFSEIFSIFDMYFCVRIELTKDCYRYGIINDKGHIILNCIFTKIELLSDYYIGCHNGYSVEIRNRNLDVIYNSIPPKIASRYIITYNNVINDFGQKLFSNSYKDIKYFCKDYFVVQKPLDEGKWSYGVIDSRERTIIDFNYQLIETLDERVIVCFTEAFHFDNHLVGLGKCEYYNNTFDLICSSSEERKPITLLSPNRFKIKSESKFGIIDSQGTSYSKIEYDDIINKGSFFIVFKDNKFGIIDYCGKERLAPVYSFFKKLGNSTPIRYNDCYIVTEPSKSIGEGVFDLASLYSIKKEEEFEIFSFDRGILKNSSFREISFITKKIVRVKTCDGFGLYDTEQQELVVPCSYDQIRYEGGRCVFVSQNEKWGAISIDNDSESIEEGKTINVPINFEEINILAQDKYLFSVKSGDTYYIVNEKGTQIWESQGFKKHYTYYSNTRVLTMDNNKYGFIDIDNLYVSIPFIYDELVDRGDDTFDVRIGKAWGRISLAGKEILPIKYSNKVSKGIVQDAISLCYGVVGKDGKEYIPCIYPKLYYTLKDVFIFCIEDLDKEEEYYHTNALRGCLNSSDGAILIPPKYHIIRFYKDYILGGKGYIVHHWENCNYDYADDEISGIYEMYDSKGVFAIGGFSAIEDIEYNGNKYYILRLFDRLNYFIDEIDENDFSMVHREYNYYNDTRYSRWLFLDCNFSSVLKSDIGETISFQHTSINLSKKLPIELLYNERPHIDDDLVLLKNKLSILYSLKSNSIIASHEDLCLHQDLHDDNGIRNINKYILYRETVDNEKYVGISKIVRYPEEDIDVAEKLIVDRDYVIITKPVSGFSFMMKYIYGGNYYSVYFIDFNTRDYNTKDFYTIEVIQCIEKIELNSMLVYGYFYITIDESEDGLRKVIVPEKKIFDNWLFQQLISKNERGFKDKHKKKLYWYSATNLAYEDWYAEEEWEQEAMEDYRRRR